MHKKDEKISFCAQLFVTLRSMVSKLLTLGKKRMNSFCYALVYS